MCRWFLATRNGAVVDRRPESLQQVLLDGQLKGGLAIGVNKLYGVLRDPERVAHAQLNAGAGQEALLDSKVADLLLRHQVVLPVMLVAVSIWVLWLNWPLA